jgi:lipopolysaccharide biosynthesis glycosyltransferase
MYRGRTNWTYIHLEFWRQIHMQHVWRNCFEEEKGNECTKLRVTYTESENQKWVKYIECREFEC